MRDDEWMNSLIHDMTEQKGFRPPLKQDRRTRILLSYIFKFIWLLLAALKNFVVIKTVASNPNFLPISHTSETLNPLKSRKFKEKGNFNPIKLERYK